MGNFFNLGDYLDPIARVWGGGETLFTAVGRGREEVKKETDSSENRAADTEAGEHKFPEDERVK